MKCPYLILSKWRRKPMADKENKTQPQPPVDPAPGPTEGMLQPVDRSRKDPNAKPVYLVNGVLVDPDGNPVKGK
jgi:hypothetical protein